MKENTKEQQHIFTNQMLRSLLIPVIFEQVLNNNIASLYKVGRDVYALAVYKNVLVVNDLSGFLSCSCETKTEDNVVKSALKKDHKVFTCLSV